MNHKSKWYKIFSFVLAFIMIMPTLVLASEQLPTTRKISIYKVEGTANGVTIQRGIRKNFVGVAGISLAENDEISTDSQTILYLEIDDEKIVKVDKNSKISISKASTTELKITLISGNLYFDTKGIVVGPSLFGFNAGGSIMGVRGTSGTISLNGTEVITTIFQGEVFVSNEQNEGELVQTGQTQISNATSGTIVTQTAQLEQMNAFTIESLIEALQSTPATQAEQEKQDTIKEALTLQDTNFEALQTLADTKATEEARSVALMQSQADTLLNMAVTTTTTPTYVTATTTTTKPSSGGGGGSSSSGGSSSGGSNNNNHNNESDEEDTTPEPDEDTEEDTTPEPDEDTEEDTEEDTTPESDEEEKPEDEDENIRTLQHLQDLLATEQIKNIVVEKEIILLVEESIKLTATEPKIVTIYGTFEWLEEDIDFIVGENVEFVLEESGKFIGDSKTDTIKFQNTTFENKGDISISSVILESSDLWNYNEIDQVELKGVGNYVNNVSQDSVISKFIIDSTDLNGANENEENIIENEKGKIEHIEMIGNRNTIFNDSEIERITIDTSLVLKTQLTGYNTIYNTGNIDSINHKVQHLSIENKGKIDTVIVDTTLCELADYGYMSKAINSILNDETGFIASLQVLGGANEIKNYGEIEGISLDATDGTIVYMFNQIFNTGIIDEIENKGHLIQLINNGKIQKFTHFASETDNHSNSSEVLNSSIGIINTISIDVLGILKNYGYIDLIEAVGGGKGEILTYTNEGTIDKNTLEDIIQPSPDEQDEDEQDKDEQDEDEQDKNEQDKNEQDKNEQDDDEQDKNEQDDDDKNNLTDDTDKEFNQDSSDDVQGFIPSPELEEIKEDESEEIESEEVESEDIVDLNFADDLIVILPNDDKEEDENDADESEENQEEDEIVVEEIVENLQEEIMEEI